MLAESSALPVSVRVALVLVPALAVPVSVLVVPVLELVLAATVHHIRMHYLGKKAECDCNASYTNRLL